MHHLRRNHLSLLVLLGLCFTPIACSNSNNGGNGRFRAFGGKPSVEQKLDAILHARDDGSAKIVARVVDLSTGRELYAENADDPVIPASNLKLFVTAAALDFFGPDHTFETYLVKDGSDLWIIGTGDPGLGDPAIAARRGGDTLTVFDEWVEALRNKGEFNDLYYYDRALDGEWVHPTWDDDDLVHWYAAPVTGLNFNDNCVDITIYPTQEGKPVRYEVMPPVRDIKIINNCVTGGTEPPSIDRAQNENTYTLSGGCKQKTALKSKPVTDPGAFLADAFRTHLEASGMKIKGEIKRAERPPLGSIHPPSQMVVAIHRTSIRELLPRINKSSQNLLAEGLCKLLGRAYAHEHWRPAPGSWGSGSDAIHAFLERQGIEHEALVFADGSGLSRDNRVTTRAISDLLVKMRAHPHGDVFFESLSVGGVSGTIRGRFTDRPGVVHAKTGYIGGVRSLSGYVPSSRGGQIVFSFIYNGVRGSVKPYEELQDQAVRLLMSYPELNYVAPATTQPATRPSRERNRTRPRSRATTAPITAESR
jgi:D-alanyl-D-alanine carboxypeptidase/D-alanyl-D-alanine-endopeptidase (penicillin-binding protein 4)